MTFHLAYADDHVLLTSKRPVIKRRDTHAFDDALSLLQEATMIRDRARDAAETARAEARREGLAEARAAANDAVRTGLADITAAIEAHAEARRADIAEAAFAAARAIVGDLDDVDAMQRIVDRTIARLDTDMPVVVEVAAALAPALSAQIAKLANVSVTANADFAPTDCRISTATGRTVASLSVQFDALAARWGL